jgi:hypothetical protein
MEIFPVWNFNDLYPILLEMYTVKFSTWNLNNLYPKILQKLWVSGFTYGNEEICNILSDKRPHSMPGLYPRSRLLQGRFRTTKKFQVIRPRKAILILIHISPYKYIHVYIYIYIYSTLYLQADFVKLTPCVLICGVSCFWLLKGYVMLNSLCVRSPNTEFFF